MRFRPSRLQSILRSSAHYRPQWSSRRLTTLAIETSCDDTSVAILEKENHYGQAIARLHFHKKVTSDNSTYHGVHPLVSLQSHQENLAGLVNEAIHHLPLQRGDDASKLETMRRLPDFVAVTRGPGMRSNLFTGLDTAKGLAVAWQRPLVGVHHMQAHALTPRMVSALESGVSWPTHPEYLFSNDSGANSTVACSPKFPFLSLLASGGHTLLIHSAALTSHHVLGSTDDIAIGECLDKIARVVLPSNVLHTTKSTMYGALLEGFALPDPLSASHNERPSFPAQSASGHSAKIYLQKYGSHYNWYEVGLNHEQAKLRNTTKWGWRLDQPLTKSDGGTKIKSLNMSFSGLTTAVERLVRFGIDPVTQKYNKFERAPADVSIEERKDIAKETMRAAFEHVASRVVLGIQALHDATFKPAVVMAGGVAANSFLRHILASTMCAHGYSGVTLHFPPPLFCTDNAAMIAWAGLEMFESGYTDPLTIRAIRKWPLDRLLHPMEDG